MLEPCDNCTNPTYVPSGDAGSNPASDVLTQGLDGGGGAPAFAPRPIPDCGCDCGCDQCEGGAGGGTAGTAVEASGAASLPALDRRLTGIIAPEGNFADTADLRADARS
jgi:hypothetical protein